MGQRYKQVSGDPGDLPPRSASADRDKLAGWDGVAPFPSPYSSTIFSDVGGKFLGRWPEIDYSPKAVGDVTGVLHHVTTIHYVSPKDNTNCIEPPDKFLGMDTVDKIKAALIAEFGSVADFARSVGWEPVTVRQQLNRGSISKDLALAIAKKLKVSVESVLEGNMTAARKPDGNGHAPLTPQDHNDIAQALEDALKEKGIKIGAAEKATLIAGFLEKLEKKGR
jgi:hypothetical protein